MRQNLRCITPPASLPVSLAEAKSWIRLDHDLEDALIERLIRAATNALDGPAGFLGRALMPQTWELVFDAFPAHEIEVPLGPIASVAEITFTDPAGVGQTVPAAAFELDRVATFGGWIVPVDGFSWPATMATIGAVSVRVVVGTGAPEGVRQAILDMIAARYDMRGEGRMLSPGIAGDLARFRRPVL